MSGISFKAIFLGTFITVVILLSGQLAYVLIASYVGTAATDIQVVNEHKDALWFGLSMLTYSICFYLGGAFTAAFASQKPVLNAALVGGGVAFISVITSGELSDINYRAGILIVLGLIFSSLGARPSKAELESSGTS